MFSDLLHKAKRGDRAAIGKLLNSHADRVRAMALQELGGAASRRDVNHLVTSTTEEIYAEIVSFAGDTEQEWFEWVRQILKQSIDDEGTCESDRIRVAIATLPQVQGQVVRLSMLNGWHITRIGRHLGLDELTVAGLLRQGLKRLRDVISPREGSTDD